MNRRDFLTLTSLSTLGLLNQNFGIPAKNLRLAVQLYSVRNQVAQDLKGTLRKLSKSGFSHLEIYGYDGKFFGLTAKEFRKMTDDAGLSVVSSHHLPGLSAAVPGSFVSEWNRTLDDLNVIGAKYAVSAWLPENERTPDHYRQLADLLNKTGEISRKSGIRIAHHNHDFEFDTMYHVTPAYDFLLENTDPKVVEMELDLYWITKAGQDPVEYFIRYPGRFPLWHLKDMCAGTKDFCEVGKGTIDFDRIFSRRYEAGLSYWFIEQDESRGDIFESLKTSRDFVRAKHYAF